jgi:chromosome partitioning protein
MSEPTKASTTSLQLLRQTYTGLVFSTVIPRNTDIREAHINKQDIFSFSPGATSAHLCDKLIQELFRL